MKEISDNHIVALMQSSQDREQGFKLLMQKYQERMYWHIRRMVVDHEDANDVIQNTLVKVFKGINRFEGKSKLYTWLYRIATNEALTFLKKQKGLMHSSIEEGENNLSQQLKADDYFDGDEAVRLLKLAVAQLPEKQRLVFNMRYYDEMSYQDIADVVGTSVGGLKASYHHAVKKIEHYFREVAPK